MLLRIKDEYKYYAIKYTQMNKCHQCNKNGAMKQCTGCRSAVYCGLACQRQAWNAGHSAECANIGMKRGRQESSESEDPFTLEKFTGMDPKVIITLEGKRFHLPSLYHWIHNQDNRTNPYTNLDFTQESMDVIAITARERFPMEIQIKEFNGRTELMHTTALISIKKLAFLLYETDSMNAMIHKMVLGHESFTINREWLARLVIDKPNDQLMVDVLIIHRLLNLGGPESALGRMRMILRLAQRFHLPTDEIEQHIVVYERNFDAHEHIRVQQNALRERIQQRRAEREEHLAQPPGTLRVGINIFTNLGAAYGIFFVYLPEDGKVRDLVQLIHEKVDGIIPYPPNGRFIFAGRMVPNDSMVRDIPNWREESLIHFAP